MARETIERITCDRCRKPCKAGSCARVSAIVHGRLDAAGDTEEVYDDVDLCAECLGKELNGLLRTTLRQDERVDWFETVRAIGAKRG